MSLRNLLKIGQLEEHETDANQVRRMLQSAERSIADATQTSISPETRLDAAYRAITQLSMIALWTNVLERRTGLLRASPNGLPTTSPN